MRSIDDVWAEYVALLAEVAPQARVNVGPPATDDMLKAVEETIGQALPREARRLLGLADGERAQSGCNLLPGLTFLSCSGITREWRMWAQLRETESSDELESLDDSCRALDPGVLDVYTHAGWIPLLQDTDRSDYLGLDLAPTPSGARGQVINFGRDEDRHFVAFVSLTELLEFWLGEVRAGRCEQLAPAPSGPWRLSHRGGNPLDILRGLRGKS